MAKQEAPYARLAKPEEWVVERDYNTVTKVLRNAADGLLAKSQAAAILSKVSNVDKPDFA